MKSIACPAAGLVLGRRQLYMLPTRHGLYFACALTAMLLMAVNYSNGLAYLFTFLLGSTAVVSMLYTHRNVAGLRFGGGGATPVFVDQDACFRVRVENPDALRRPAVWLHQQERARRVDFAPGETTEVAFHVTARQRGFLELGPVAVSSAFPLGILYTWSRWIDLGLRCLVYPRPVSLRPLPQSPPRPGWTEAGQHAEGDDFVGLRDFREGDPPRHVHWKAAARGQGLVTKQFGGAAGGELWIDWDTLEGLDGETRLSQMTRWVLDADSAKLRYGLRLPGREIGPNRGQGHYHQCLRTLALWR